MLKKLSVFFLLNQDEGDVCLRAYLAIDAISKAAINTECNV